jgi:hypothetical protein
MVKNAPARYIVKLLEHAKDKETDKLAWEMWLTSYSISIWTKDKLMPYNEFLEKVKGTYTTMTDSEYEDIIERSKRINMKG